MCGYLLRLGDYGWRKIKLNQIDFFVGGGDSLRKVSAFSILAKEIRNGSKNVQILGMKL